MSKTTKDQMISAACALLEAQGYHATGLNQILYQSGTPKGSLYYHFPEGKTELVSEAISRTGETLSLRIEKGLAARKDPADAVRNLAETIARQIEKSNFQAGGPLTMVALETAAISPRINLACRQAFQIMQQAFQRKLEDSSIPPARAKTLAEHILVVIEGATLLSRTFHSGDPLRRAGKELYQHLKRETN